MRWELYILEESGFGRARLPPSRCAQKLGGSLALPNRRPSTVNSHIMNRPKKQIGSLPHLDCAYYPLATRSRHALTYMRKHLWSGERCADIPSKGERNESKAHAVSPIYRW